MKLYQSLVGKITALTVEYLEDKPCKEELLNLVATKSSQAIMLMILLKLF
jgi:hypothetical protein